MRPHVLEDLKLHDDGIFGALENGDGQQAERAMRESVAAHKYDDYFVELAKYHSVEVMYKEVRRFTDLVPEHGVILDVGGGWGWHWRRIAAYRPDLQVVIVDFVRSNLHHARNILGSAVGQNVWLIHGDATKLVFQDLSFDAYWSVQTLQHIERFDVAVREAHRVLKAMGAFATYSLNNAALVRWIYRLRRKRYILNGVMPNGVYLRRADSEQADIIAHIFQAPVQERFSEVLFHPDLRMPVGGRENSIIGKLDAGLAWPAFVARLVARQHSFHAIKRSAASS
jgi:ubiquinone/menaquinone biosynthesis C-methylase UbiE